MSKWRQRCLFFLSLNSGAGAHRSHPAPLLCGHRSREGCLSANQRMPVQVRLTAPIFHQIHAAGASLRSRVSKTPRVRGNALRDSAFSNESRSAHCMAAGAATPKRRATFSNRGKVQNQESFIRSRIVVQLHVPQPFRVVSHVKIANRL